MSGWWQKDVYSWQPGLPTAQAPPARTEQNHKEAMLSWVSGREGELRAHAKSLERKARNEAKKLWHNIFLEDYFQ